MNDLLENLRAVNESDDQYSTKIEVDIHVKDYEIESVSNVTIRYELEFEHRSWGIKDVTFHPVGEVEIEVSLVDLNVEDAESKSVVIKVDLSKAKIDWVSGAAYIPKHLDVDIDKDGNVKSSMLTVQYLNPTDF